MSWSEPLARTPGEFRARCNLAVSVVISRATYDQRRQAEALKLQQHHAGSDHRGKPIWVWKFPVCGGFETDDRVAYRAHLDEFHNGGRQKLVGPWLKMPAKLWTGPRLTVDGKPVTDPDGRLRRCPTCGLHGEVRDLAGERWWDEHVNGCALATAGAAS